MFLSTPMLIALKAFSERTNELSWVDTFLQGRTECDPDDNAIVHDVLDEPTDACDAPDAIPEEEIADGSAETTEEITGDDDDRLAPAIT